MASGPGTPAGGSGPWSTSASAAPTSAAYEHRVFTQGVVWGINPFDQWGVEVGKIMASQLAPELQSESAPEYDSDSSTNALVRLLRQGRGRPA